MKQLMLLKNLIIPRRNNASRKQQKKEPYNTFFNIQFHWAFDF